MHLNFPGLFFMLLLGQSCSSLCSSSSGKNPSVAKRSKIWAKLSQDVRIQPSFVCSDLWMGQWAGMLDTGIVCFFLLVFLLSPSPDPQVPSCFPSATHVCCEHICQVCRTSLVGFGFGFFSLVLQNLPCPSKHVNRLILQKACDSFVFQASTVVFLCVCCFCCSGRNTPILDRSDLQGF